MAALQARSRAGDDDQATVPGQNQARSAKTERSAPNGHQRRPHSDRLLDGVLNAKAEIFSDAFGFAEIPTAQVLGTDPLFAAHEGSEAYDAMDRMRRSGERNARDMIALGALVRGPEHSKSDSDGKLGIFVQRRRLVHHPIVDKAVRTARGEARVIVTGPIRRHSALATKPCRPLTIGASVGHHRITAGTLGCFVRRRKDGSIGILSNNHVLADCSRGRIGDVILQPSRADGGDLDTPGHRVARLSDVVEIDFAIGAINFVDAAVATLIDGVGSIPGSVGQHPVHWMLGRLDPLVLSSQRVKKLGRTTQLTEGFIEAIGVDNLNVNFFFGQKGGTARFDRQISIVGAKGAFSKPGDSGSLICSEAGRPMALLMAGSRYGGLNGRGLSFASPLETVCDSLQVDLYSGL